MLDAHNGSLWIYIIFFCALMIPYQGWAPTATTFEHSYTLSSPPGQLYTERGSFYFIVYLLLPFIWLVPITAAAMTAFVQSKWIRTLHLTITFLLWLFFIAVFVYGIYAWSVVNPDPLAPEDSGVSLTSVANDKRYCCVYGFVGAPCPLSTLNQTCSPFVSADALTADGTFIFAFLMNLVLVVLLTFDFFYVTCVYSPNVRRELRYQRERATERGNGNKKTTLLSSNKMR